MIKHKYILKHPYNTLLNIEVNSLTRDILIQYSYVDNLIYIYAVYQLHLICKKHSTKISTKARFPLAFIRNELRRPNKLTNKNKVNRLNYEESEINYK